MTGRDIRRATLEEINRMHERGEIRPTPPNTPPGPDLGEEFWKNAKVVYPKSQRSVHLKLDEDVFQFFKAQGKGHLTRMQAVLRAYVKAQRTPGE